MTLLDPDMTLIALIDRVAQADETALLDLYQLTSATLYDVALRVVTNRQWAEDVLQDAFVNIWRFARNFEPTLSPPMAWLALIVHGRGLDFLRRRAVGTADRIQEPQPQPQPQAVPSPVVWQRIENLVKADRQTEAMQVARLPTARPRDWWDSLNLWRGLSSMGVGVAAVALMVATSLNGINTKLGSEVQELTAKLSAAPAIQYVAVLADDKAAASMLVTFDPKSKRLTLKRSGGFQETPDKSLQLWALPQAGGAKSLGVLGNDAVTRLTAEKSDLNAPTLAISLEPKGGVVSAGGPTGPVLFKGALIETAL